MKTISRYLFALLAIAPLLAVAAAASPPVTDPVNDPSTQLRQAVVSIRTLVGDGSAPISTGSGFFVGASGRFVTNHHVVGLFMRKPLQYRLQIALPDGATATAKIVGFSLVDDLAVLQLSKPMPAGVTWIELSRSLSTPKEGSSIYAIGDPSGMGLMSTRGHYSGLRNKAGFERYHFTGTLNPGMSGGPAVNQLGQLVGVNAARRRNAEQMSFLVPAARVQALVASTAQNLPLDPPAVAAEIRRQLAEFHAKESHISLSSEQARARFGPYEVPSFGADRLNCSTASDMRSDDGDALRPVEVQGVGCQMETSLELGDDIVIGHVEYSHRKYRAVSLNSWRFNTAMHQFHRQNMVEGATRSIAAAQCVDRFTQVGLGVTLPIRLIWCVQAYREFEGLYDLRVSVLTRDRSNEALVSKLVLYGVTWAQADAYTRHLLGGIK